MTAAMLPKNDPRNIFISFLPVFSPAFSDFQSSQACYSVLAAESICLPCAHSRRVPRHCADREIRTHFLKTRFRNTFDRQQVFHFLKGAALLAEVDDGFCGARTDSRYLLQLLHRRGV